MALCIRVKDLEFFHIGDDIRISIERSSRTESRVWIEAPKDLKILREKHLPEEGPDDGEQSRAD